MVKKNPIYCEPFCIRQGQNFEIHQVSYKESDPYSCFMHFHEVHELIVFGQIEGSFFYNQGESELQSHDLVFTPALETHDFELTEKPKDWFIVQFLPSVIQEPQLSTSGDFFKCGMHLRPSQEAQHQISQIVQWLLTSYEVDPFSEKSQLLLQLLLAAVAEGSLPVHPPHTEPLQRAAGFERLNPVINLFRHNRHVELSLTEAAELCHLSPSYFSRLFKSVFRCSYSAYNARHRLYSAARLLSQSDHNITSIAYELGFSSPSHFISLFKKQFGVTPKQYHNQVAVKAVEKA